MLLNATAYSVNYGSRESNDRKEAVVVVQVGMMSQRVPDSRWPQHLAGWNMPTQDKWPSVASM